MALNRALKTTAVEKAFNVLELSKIDSVNVVQCHFKTYFEKSSFFYDSYKRFETTS